MLRLAQSALLILCAQGCLAAPVWETAETIDNLTVYKDHLDPARFYFEPATYRVAMKDAAPQVYYRLFRYLGTTETRDSNEFKVSGVLSIDVEQSDIAARYARAVATLKSKYPRARLTALPVELFSATLNYIAIGPAGDEQSGILDEVASGDSQNVDPDAEDGAARKNLFWLKRRFTLAFDPLTAELFWNNFENDRLQLSMSYSVLSEGMRLNKEQHWESDKRRFSDSIPIVISMQEHANHFSKTETWQLTTRRRTDVIVMCYDFLEPEVDDLYRVLVEIQFKTLRDQDYREKVKFDSQDEHTEQTVSFRLARGMNEPYYYRVTRIFRSKSIEQSNWIEHRGLLLDVTSYAM